MKYLIEYGIFIIIIMANIVIGTKSIENFNNNINKKLFIYWAQGFNNAPYLVKKCLLSWKVKNPTWKIVELDDNNLIQYIDIEKDIPSFKNKNITKTAYSDIIRVFLLDKYGGCWCDATTFCNKPLDDWLEQYIQSGFFAFEHPATDRLLASWFLYSEPKGYIIKKWKEDTIKYWEKHNKIGSYFWFHYLFGNLYKIDDTFKKIWDSTPKISADDPHFVQHNGLLNPISDKVKNHINNIKSPLYKLTYKYDENKSNNNCNLVYLLNTIS